MSGYPNLDNDNKYPNQEENLESNESRNSGVI